MKMNIVLSQIGVRVNPLNPLWICQCTTGLQKLSADDKIATGEEKRYIYIYIYIFVINVDLTLSLLVMTLVIC